MTDRELSALWGCRYGAECIYGPHGEPFDDWGFRYAVRLMRAGGDPMRSDGFRSQC